MVFLWAPSARTLPWEPRKRRKSTRLSPRAWLQKIKAEQRQLFSACSRVSDLCNVFRVSLSLPVSCVCEHGEEVPHRHGCLFKQVGAAAAIKAQPRAPRRQPCLLFCQVFLVGLDSSLWSEVALRKDLPGCPHKERKEKSPYVSRPTWEAF